MRLICLRAPTSTSQWISSLSAIDANRSAQSFLFLSPGARVSSSSHQLLRLEWNRRLAEACICCGRLKGHRHWCLHNPDVGPPIGEEPAPAKKLTSGLCLCGAKLRGNRRRCVQCIMSLRKKTGLILCLVCAKEFTPSKRMGRFVCPNCA